MYVHKVYKLYVTIRISEGIVPAGEGCYTLKESLEGNEWSQSTQYIPYRCITSDCIGAEISGLHKEYTLKLSRSHSAEKPPILWTANEAIREVTKTEGLLMKDNSHSSLPTTPPALG